MIVNEILQFIYSNWLHLILMIFFIIGSVYYYLDIQKIIKKRDSERITIFDHKVKSDRKMIFNIGK